MLSLTDCQIINSPIDRSFHGFKRTQVIDDALILVTESPHVAAVYNIETGKSICSWYFTESERLTCPVIYDYVSKKCLAVQQNHYLTELSLPKSREPAEDANNNLDHENGIDAGGDAMEIDNDHAQDEKIKYRFSLPITCLIANKDGEALVLLGGSVRLKSLSAAKECRSEHSTIGYFPFDKIVTVELLTPQRSSKFTSVPQTYEVMIISEEKSSKWCHRFIVDTISHQVDLKETFELPSLVVLNIHPVTGFICGIDEAGSVIQIKYGLAKTVHRLQTLSRRNHLDEGTSKSNEKNDHSEVLQTSKIRCITSFVSIQDLIALFIDVTDSEFLILTLDLRYGFTQETAISLPPLDSSCVQLIDDSMYILSTTGLSIHTFSIRPVTLASITREKAPHCVDGHSNSVNDSVNSNDLSKDAIRLLDSLPSMKIGEMLETLTKFKKQSGGIIISESITAVLVNELICRQPNLKRTETEQLIEVILRTPFAPARLVGELRAKSIEPCKVLKTMSILLDRASEEDVLTAHVLDLVSALMDCSLAQILSRVDTLSDLMIELKGKLDQISVFYTVATSLKSYIDAILSKNFKFEPLISLKANEPIPPYSVVVMNI